MGRSVNVLVDFNDTKISYLYGLNDQTVVFDKLYTKEGVYYISAMMINITNNQLVKDKMVISVISKIHNIFF